LDVFVFPADLSATLSAADVILIDTAFVPLNIPTGFTTANTWQQVVNQVLRIFLFATSVQGRGLRMMPVGTTVATTWNSIPAAQRTALQSAADDFGVAKTQMRAGVLYGDVLKDVANQFSGRIPVKLGGVDH